MSARLGIGGRGFLILAVIDSGGLQTPNYIEEYKDITKLELLFEFLMTLGCTSMRGGHHGDITSTHFCPHEAIEAVKIVRCTGHKVKCIA